MSLSKDVELLTDCNWYNELFQSVNCRLKKVDDSKSKNKRKKVILCLVGYNFEMWNRDELYERFSTLITTNYDIDLQIRSEFSRSKQIESTERPNEDVYVIYTTLSPDYIKQFINVSEHSNVFIWFDMNVGIKMDLLDLPLSNVYLGPSFPLDWMLMQNLEMKLYAPRNSHRTIIFCDHVKENIVQVAFNMQFGATCMKKLLKCSNIQHQASSITYQLCMQIKILFRFFLRLFQMGTIPRIFELNSEEKQTLQQACLFAVNLQENSQYNQLTFKAKEKTKDVKQLCRFYIYALQLLCRLMYDSMLCKQSTDNIDCIVLTSFVPAAFKDSDRVNSTTLFSTSCCSMHDMHVISNILHILQTVDNVGNLRNLSKIIWSQSDLKDLTCPYTLSNFDDDEPLGINFDVVQHSEYVTETVHVPEFVSHEAVKQSKICPNSSLESELNDIYRIYDKWFPVFITESNWTNAQLPLLLEICNSKNIIIFIIESLFPLVEYMLTITHISNGYRNCNLVKGILGTCFALRYCDLISEYWENNQFKTWSMDKPLYRLKFHEKWLSTRKEPSFILPENMYITQYMKYKLGPCMPGPNVLCEIVCQSPNFPLLCTLIRNIKQKEIRGIYIRKLFYLEILNLKPVIKLLRIIRFRQIMAEHHLQKFMTHLNNETNSRIINIPVTHFPIHSMKLEKDNYIFAVVGSDDTDQLISETISITTSVLNTCYEPCISKIDKMLTSKTRK
jgi:hypothetical protein